jgi:thioredoxin 1
MNSSNNTRCLRTSINVFFILLGVLFLVLLGVYKGEMNTLVSTKMKEQAGEDVQKDIAIYVDSAFNYQKNKETFAMTFLEFGATGCISCKKMEKVMEDVNINYPDKVKVKFINVLIPENQGMMKYFGIAAIPTQVLLNNEGQEVFRHTGYYSFDELTKEFQKINP